MSKRHVKKVIGEADPGKSLCKALAKSTKADLIDVLVELAGNNPSVTRPYRVVAAVSNLLQISL